MNRKYSLIVQSTFSLSNETDADIMTDYFPGIWGIKTQKKALEYAKELIANGDTITRVTCYENPAYYPLANKFIKELGLDLPLFEEIAPLKKEVVTKPGIPQNLSQLKKFLTPGKKIFIKSYFGEAEPRLQRITSVIQVFSNNMTVEKTLGSGTKSWLDFGKASDWAFTNTSATLYNVYREGRAKAVEIIYELPQE